MFGYAVGAHECYGFQTQPSQFGAVAASDASPRFADVERKFGFKLLAETIKASGDQGNQLVAPLRFFRLSPFSF